MDESILTRFMEKVDKTGNCWLWTGSLDRDGYGRLSIDGRNESAHRIMYIHCFGVPDKGLQICHKPIICHNPACCNPEHLDAKPKADNEADKFLDKTNSKKLSVNEIIEIRKRVGESQTKIAQEFGVSQALIGKIINKKLWKHVT